MKPIETRLVAWFGRAAALLLALVVTTGSASAQSNPTAQSLPYLEDFSGLAAGSTTYPTGWQGWRLATSNPGASFRTTAPTLDQALVASSTAATTAGGVHNYNGTVGFLISSSLDVALALAINTTGGANVGVSYDISTIRNPYDGASNTRINEATLQYRVGTSGSFTTLTGGGIEYQNNTTTQTSAVTTPQNQVTKSVVLPPACDNQSVVQLRWVSREVSGLGSRPSFALDNVQVVQALASEPTVAASALVFSAVMPTSLDVSWTSGDGAARIVVAKESSAVAGTPVDGTSYAASSAFGAGATIAADEYVVFNGASSTAAVTGLAPGTTYHFAIFELNGTENYLVTTPGTGSQVTVPLAPTTAAATDISDTGFTANWSAVTGAADYRLDVATDFAFTAYVAGYQDRTVAGISEAVTGLTAETAYFYRVLAVNGGGTSDDSGTETVMTLASEPMVQASALVFSSISGTSMDLSWTNGDGAARIVVAKAGSAVIGTPLDGTTYFASSVFGTGDVVDADEYVVFNGPGSSFTLTGLAPTTTYHFAIFESNGSGGTENYLVTTPATGIQSTTVATYTWNRMGGGSWPSPGNWTPSRNTPATSDILRFDGANIAPGSFVTDIPTQTIGQLHLLNLANFQMVSRGPGFVLTISGGPGVDFSSDLDTQVFVVGGQSLEILVGAGATASLSGSLAFTGSPHRLDAVDAGGITFQNRAACIQGSGCTGNLFKASGTANAIIFASGSTFRWGAGSDPFGLTQPASKVVFQSGSLFDQQQNTPPSFSGRTYGDFQLKTTNPNAINVGGSAPLSIDNIRFLTGFMRIDMTGGFNLRGNIDIGPSGRLSVNQGSVGTLTLNGSAMQSISNTGILLFNPGCTVDVDNPSGVSLGTNVTVGGTLVLTHGNVVTNSNVLTIGSPSTSGDVVATGGHVVGNLERTMVVSGGSASQTWPIGDDTAYTPVELTGSGFPADFQLTASTTPGDHPDLAASGIDSDRSVNRSYTLLTAPTPGTYDIKLTFDPADLDLAADPSRFVVRKNTDATWSGTTTGTRTATTIQATGLSGFSEFSIGEQAIDHYLVEATSPQYQGATFATSVTAKDVLDETVSDDNTTAVTMTSDGSAEFDADGNATFGDDVKTLTNGAFSIDTRDNTLETVTLTATDGNSKTGSSGGVEIIAAPVVDNVAAEVSPGTCISTSNPCVTVPVVFTRTDATPVRAYSVQLQLSSELSLCGAGFTAGAYLDSVGSASFHTINHGGGIYTVDESILGLPCGATGDGTLFTISLGSGVASGTGTITILSVIVRDCANAPVPGIPGATASVDIDNTTPAAIAGLAAQQQKLGNAPPPTTFIQVTWPPVELGASVQVFRKGFGAYPEYDDAGGSVPAAPATPVAAISAGWVLTSLMASGQSDQPPTRDFWYYVAFVTDGCGNVSVVSNRTNGTLDYHLGDTHNGLADCSGDNLVGTSDISFLGANYGATLVPASDPRACLDFGPTTDFTVDGRPTTDNQLQFEDMIMAAINYGTVSKQRISPAPAAVDELVAVAPNDVEAGTTFSVELSARATGRVQGLSTRLSWDPAVVEPLGVTAGALLESQGGVALTPEPGVVDAALLGVGDLGLAGEGTLASVRFHSLTAGDPGIRIASIDARDARNRRVEVHIGIAPVTSEGPPRVTALLPSVPNPFNPSTKIGFTLATPGPVDVSIYDAAGRKVTTLVHESRNAGWYAVSWDGTDARGARIASGAYYVRLVTSREKRTSVITLVK